MRHTNRPLARLANTSAVALTFVLLLTGALVMGVESSIGVGHYTDVDYPDSAMVLRVRELLRTGQLYPALDRPPYMLSVYGPLAYVVLAIPYALAELVQINPVIAMRVALLASLVVCFAMVYRISRQLNAARFTSVLCVLFAASSTPLAAWTVQLRADLPALALSLASIHLAIGANGRWRTAMAICCAGAAPLIKQTFIAAPFAIIVWHLLHRRRREAVLWTVGVGMIVVGGLAFTAWREPQMLTHLKVMRGPVLDYWTGEWPETGFGLLWTAASQPLIPFLAIGAFLSLSDTPGLRRLVLPFCVTAWLMSAFIAAHVGSSFNVFWEPLFASALLAGPGLAALMHRDVRVPPAVSFLLPPILLAICLSHVAPDIRRVMASPTRLASRSAEKARWESFVAAVSGRRLLSTLPSVAILSSQPEMPDPIANSEMELAGSWSSAPVVAALAAHAYDLVVISSGEADPAQRSPGFRGTTRWNERMWRVLTERYALAWRCGELEIWMPPRRSDDAVALESAGCARAPDRSPAAPGGLTTSGTEPSR